MIAEIDRLKVQLAALGDRDRAAMARFLLDSLDDQQFCDTTLEKVEFHSVVQAELERREIAYRTGESTASPAEQVFERLGARYT